MGRVKGKVAMVTGGASGFGEATSRLLAQEGAAVVVADIAVDAGMRVVEQMRAEGLEAWFVPLDVTSEAQWQEAMDAVVAKYRKLNVLVNNAGIAPDGSMESSFELWRKVMSINLDGVFLGSRAAIRVMRGCGEPCAIVNISSIMAQAGGSSSVAYCASKGGVSSLTRATALYCADEKLPIRVNSIQPGMCLTPLVRDYYSDKPEALRAQSDYYPIGHIGEMVDIAQGVLYLASDESKFVLGSELVIDGGFLAR